jgi:hypothetical protein
MPSRRTFIAGGAAAAAAFSVGLRDTPAADAAAPKGPSAFGLAQARWLQSTMPGAHLSDALAKKIAGDIDGYAPVAAEFRKAKLQNWDEPDFVFAAGPKARRT